VRVYSRAFCPYSGRGSFRPVRNKGKSGIFCHYTVFAHRPTSF